MALIGNSLSERIASNSNVFKFLQESAGEPAVLPTPFINLDQDQKEDVTVVELKFGDRLGALLDTVSHVPGLLIVLLVLLSCSIRRESGKDLWKACERQLIECS